VKRVLLVASAGGHLAQLLWMRSWWEQTTRTWVTFDTPLARERLATERVVFAHQPTNRNAGNLLRNARLARRVLAEVRPDVVVTTGAGVGVPFVWLARSMGAKSVFVEVFDRVDAPSLTGRLVAPFADVVVLQREVQRALYPRGVVLGPVH